MGLVRHLTMLVYLSYCCVAEGPLHSFFSIKETRSDRVEVGEVYLHIIHVKSLAYRYVLLKLIIITQEIVHQGRKCLQGTGD